MKKLPATSVLLLLASLTGFVLPARGSLSINEFLTINVEGPADKDGSLSPWVEIHNDSETDLNLVGWHLTDDPSDLTKWEIPRKTVPANGYALLFVSGKDFASLFNPEVHANFKLSLSDDYLALVEPDGMTIASHYAEIPKQRKGISYGLSENKEPRYFQIPTAMEANRAPLEGFVADTKFSVDRGFYDSPFQVEITTKTPGARIIYTTSGREPSPGSLFSGPIEHVYDGPITIEKTTVLRAAAFKDGLGPTNVDTQTYIFVDDVIKQETMRTQITESETYGPRMHEALTALPSLSLAVEDAQFVGSGNSNTNDVESPTSVEWLNPDGSAGFQVDSGISRFGGYYTNFAKKSFRLYFRKRYGPGTLKYPLFRGHEFGKAPVEEFDSLNLRSGSHDMQARGAYMSNRFVDDSMLEMGGMAPHGRFVHVYLNGVYWGQYHLRERWNAAMFAHYFGGSEDDYDAINGNDNFTSDFRAYDGDLDYWRETETLSREGQPWEVLQNRVNLKDYLEFMLLWSTGDSESEFQAVGSRARQIPFHFYMKDADGWLRSPSSGRISHPGPGRFLSSLRSQGHPDFQIFIADLIHKHYFNDGALTDNANIARLQRRVDEIEVAFIAEAARWNFRPPFDWRGYQANLIERHFPGLANTMIKRFKQIGFYPDDMTAPHFHQHGGLIEPGFLLEMTAGTLFNPQGGSFLYTLDGSDPRLPGGGVSDQALIYDRQASGITLNQTVTVKARTLEENQWSALTEATFYLGEQPQAGDLILTEIHYHPAPPSAAEIAAGFVDDNAFEFIEIYNPTDRLIELSQVSFTRGIQFSFADAATLQLGPGEATLVVQNRAAFEQRYGTSLPIAGDYPSSKLSNGGETIRLSLANGVLLYEIEFDDKDPWPKTADGEGPSLVLINPDGDEDAGDSNRWQASPLTGGSPGIISAENDSPAFFIDQDGDGLVHLLERALGSSDADPASGPGHFELRAQVMTVDGKTERYWVFETQRDPQANDLELSLEVSQDLRQWINGDQAFLELPEAPSGPGKIAWRSRQPAAALTESPSYLRLRVRQR